MNAAEVASCWIGKCTHIPPLSDSILQVFEVKLRKGVGCTAPHAESYNFLRHFWTFIKVRESMKFAYHKRRPKYSILRVFCPKPFSKYTGSPFLFLSVTNCTMLLPISAQGITPSLHLSYLRMNAWGKGKSSVHIKGNPQTPLLGIWSTNHWSPQ